MEEVTLLLSCKEKVMAIYFDKDRAEKKAAEFNTHPFTEDGDPDPDAPYKAVTWSVTQ